MGRKEFTDPESADWPVRGNHVVAPVGFALLNSLEDGLILLLGTVPTRRSLPSLL